MKIDIPTITFHIDENDEIGMEQTRIIDNIGYVLYECNIVITRHKNGRLTTEDRSRLLEKMRKRRTTIKIPPEECIGNEWEAKTLQVLPIVETNDLAFPRWEMERTRNAKEIERELIKIIKLNEERNEKKRGNKTTEKPITENAQNKITMNSDTETTINDLMKKITDDKITEYVNELEERDKVQFLLGWKLRHRIGNDRRKTILSAINAASDVIRTEIADDGRISGI